jgi:hypothetical protein
MTEATQNPIYDIYPPPIPSDDTLQPFKPGHFDYVKNRNDRELYINAYQAINQTEMWDFMKEDPGESGYMFYSHPNMQKIGAKMNELFGGYVNNPHSGCSFACTMRNMQYIARFGELKFKNSNLH